MRVAVAVLLLLGIIPPLLVGIYDRESPTLWGFPFYFWFQFLLIPITSVLTFTAYRLVTGAERRHRASQEPVEARDARGERP